MMPSLGDRRITGGGLLDRPVTEPEAEAEPTRRVHQPVAS
jgi:hypothetical protein